MRAMMPDFSMYWMRSELAEKPSPLLLTSTVTLPGFSLLIEHSTRVPDTQSALDLTRPKTQIAESDARKPLTVIVTVLAVPARRIEGYTDTREMGSENKNCTKLAV